MFSVSVMKQQYLLVVVSGRGGFARFRAVAGFVEELINAENERRVLVDLLAAEPTLSTEEHRQLGGHLATLWNGAQVAFVVPTSERVLVGEEAARANGANIRTFTNLHDAGDWLEGRENRVRR